MILNIFSSKPKHPLGDASELKKALRELPPGNALKAIEEIYGWLESLQAANDFRVDHLFDVVRQLDDAAQLHLRRVSRDYLNSPRLSKSEERRLWSVCYNYWGEVSTLYARCLEHARQNPKDRGSEALKPHLALASARLVAARAAQLKWIEFRYGPIGEDLWRGLGQPYLAAVAAGLADKPVHLYPTVHGLTSASQQYQQALIFYASSMDSLLPLEIELADRIIDHFHSGFVFSENCQSDSVYWVDASSGLPPMRLARPPLQASPGLRYFSPGTAPAALDELLRAVERGELPTDLNLGGEYAAKIVLPVLRHLSTYWAPDPPQREHARHTVKTRIAVLKGFDDCFTVFAGHIARLGKERNAESWVVDDVSWGGFGATIAETGNSLKIGSLLGVQPEGGNNWILGIVRRFNKTSEMRAGVGIQTLSRGTQAIELRPRTSGFSATGAVPGLWLREGDLPGECRIVMPIASFDLRENLELTHEKRRYLMTPIELEETGVDFEVGRYRGQLLDGSD